MIRALTAAVLIVAAPFAALAQNASPPIDYGKPFQHDGLGIRLQVREVAEDRELPVQVTTREQIETPPPGVVIIHLVKTPDGRMLVLENGQGLAKPEPVQALSPDDAARPAT